MAELCILYARASKNIVRKLYHLLSRRYSVWWDDHIHSGEYRPEIEYQLRRAKCAIPVWCATSRSSSHVLDEANYAKKHGVPVLPVRIESVDSPLGFGSLHTVDLVGWKGDPSDARIPNLWRDLAGAVNSHDTNPEERPQSLQIGKKQLQLPTFFRSVSSHETALQPGAALRALKLVRPDALLVSAYDIVRQKKRERRRMVKDLVACRSKGTVVLLDSGNYEASRKGDRRWSPKNLQYALRMTPHDLAFCFDDLTPPANVEGILRRVVRSVERESRRTASPVLPIVHAPKNAVGESSPDILPDAMARICQELHPLAIAVPERELGNGILSRAHAVNKIRRALNELGFYQPLHLLGTGNPLSIAILSSAGADWFDGLEWCRTVADGETALLYHLHQYEFFAWQSELLASPIVQEAVKSEKIAYPGKVAFHNLDFLSTWMAELREHLFAGTIERLLTEKLPNATKSVRLLESAVPGIFQ